MKRVDRSELLGLGAYEQIRERFRDRVIAEKARRRIQLGAHMSMVFENHDIVLLQVQEMLRTERISDERAIAHELETYNELVPVEGALSATLFIEYDDAIARRKMLASFASLREQIHLCLGDRMSTARFSTHFGEELDRLPAVNYVMFQVGTIAAAILRDPLQRAALEISHPAYPLRCELPNTLREELARDLDA